MVEPPYIYGDNDDLLSGKQTVLGGIWGDVWHGLEKTMNFSTRIVPGDGWGSLNEDGTWNGIINGLIQNRTQIGIASFFYTQSRGTVAAFSPADRGQTECSSSTREEKLAGQLILTLLIVHCGFLCSSFYPLSFVSYQQHTILDQKNKRIQIPSPFTTRPSLYLAHRYSKALG